MEVVFSAKMLDASKWPIFSILEQGDLEKIKKICVFGSSGNEAIYITNDDEVYAIGSNCSSCLGLGKLPNNEPCMYLVKKKVKLFISNFGIWITSVNFA